MIDRWSKRSPSRASGCPTLMILCAAFLINDSYGAERRRGLSMLLHATQERPLYTDSVSLAITLLCHWPLDDHSWSRERTYRLLTLCDLWNHADWDSVTLSTVNDRHMYYDAFNL